ncbi:MAG: energy-coupling factor ABC transporter ATP-binding protein [Pseudomonadota bacterium]
MSRAILTSTSAPLYEISGLVRAHGGKKVLDVAALEVRQGEICGVVGPNGAGKTTLLSLLAFLDRPTAGEIRFDGKPAPSDARGLVALRRQAVLIHQHPVFFSGTVKKNLEFGLKLRKVPEARRAALVEESLDLVGMRPFLHARAQSLSGGETMRAAIARAVALSPRVILCDEPTAGVDDQARAAVARLLSNVNREKGITILFTSHDAFWARNLARRRVRLYEGRLVPPAWENLFHGTVETGPDPGDGVLVLPSGLRLPAPGLSPGPARVAVDPAFVELEKGEPARNAPGVLSGTVIQVGMENGGVRILVDAVISLSAVLPMDRYRKSGILAGDRVQVRIPPAAIQEN